jgi:DNA-directed RNA polymerase I, II, and III subunit RPABC2
MDGLEEVSIDDLLNNSAEDNDTGPTFIYKKSSTKPKEKDTYDEDEENDETGLNVDDDDDEVESEDDEDDEMDAEVDAEQYENGPKFKETDNANTNTNYTLPSFIGGGDEDEDEEEDNDDDDEDANYLQKFDTDIRENFIEKHHPEAKNHNFEEVKHMSRVVRNETGIIIDNLHKTLPFLTKYETARILGQRAKQLNCGAKPFVKIPPNVIDGYEIAKLELEEKKIPFIIKRPIPDGTCEYWNVSDLEVI